MSLYAFFAFLFIGFTANAAIGTSTLGIDVSLAPGNITSASFMVVNGNNHETEVEIEVVDFERELSGAVKLLPPNSIDESLVDYISIASERITLSAGEGSTQRVQFSLELPQSATGPHWAMILVREVMSDENDGDGPSAVGELGLQFGIQIRQEDPTQLFSDGRILNVDVLPAESDKPLQVLAEYENTGNTFQRPSGELRIVNASGDVVARIEIPPFRMLPGRARQLLIDVVEPLPPGEYVALAIIDFNGEFLLAGQVRFSIS